MAEAIKSLGICLGASTVSIAQIKQASGHSAAGSPSVNSHPLLIESALYPHEGDPKRTLLKAFEQLDLSSFDKVAATGRKFRKFVNLTSISEPEAVEYAAIHEALRALGEARIAPPVSVRLVDSGVEARELAVAHLAALGATEVNAAPAAGGRPGQVAVTKPSTTSNERPRTSATVATKTRP